MKKKSKALAAILCVAMLMSLVPLMAFASEGEEPLIEIDKITLTDAGTLFDVKVEYIVADEVGEQITLLATAGEDADDTDVLYEEETDGDGNVISVTTNIVYIDQEAKHSAAARYFEFSVEKSKFTSGGYLHVKVGGTGIEEPGVNKEAASSGPADPEFPSANVVIQMNNPYGITGGGIVTISNIAGGNPVIDVTTKNVTVKGAPLYYNAARQKFVGIISESATAADVEINDGASETLTYGWVNSDEEINTIDAINIINIYLGSVSPTDKQLLAADVNDDAEINTIDAINIINRYLGSITEFLIETR